jgi:hypothetical protein
MSIKSNVSDVKKFLAMTYNVIVCLPHLFIFFQCVTLGVLRNRWWSTMKQNAAKKATEKTKRQLNNHGRVFFCKEGQHSYHDCPVRKTWLASREEMSYRNWIASVRE